MIVSIFIIKIAVQAAVKVTPAMRANLLPAHPTVKFDLFYTGVADPHEHIIHHLKQKLIRKCA